MVLVTGATGLVGSHVLLHLSENDESIRAIYRTAEGVQKTRSIFSLYGKDAFFSKINWIQADITDIPSLENVFENIDAVYHCAAFISFDPEDEEKLRKTNIEGTANIVNFCLAKGVRKLCHVSSIATLGDLKEHETIINEETEWNPEKPHSDYAISKFGAEMEIWRGFQEGLEVVIINPGVIIGPATNKPDWKTGSCEIFSRISDGLPFYTKGSTGFVGVSDVARIMLMLMKSDVNGERFIVISENVSFENMLKKVASALNVKAPTIYGRKWMTEISWRFEWILAAFFLQKRKMSKAMARALHSNNLISNEKIIGALDYKFGSVDDCVNKTAKIFKSQFIAPAANQNLQL